MTPDQAREIADAVRRVCPEQEITDLAVNRWPSLLNGLRVSECLVAVAMLGCFQREIQPGDIRGKVLQARKHAYEPGGKAWRDNLDRHGGREYEGGPVSWDEVIT